MKNYDESARRDDRDPLGIFRSLVDASVPSAGLVRPLGSSTCSLPAGERAPAEMAVVVVVAGARAVHRVRRRGAAEFLQELVECQGPRGESGFFDCEPWRGSRAGWYFDGADDIGRWWWWWRLAGRWRQWDG
jgi:hypothetical protein